MKPKTHFESDDDVARYFASVSELAAVPEPPEDLWEELDRARRIAQRRYPGQRRHTVPRPPESLRIEVSTPARLRKIYPIKVVERIEATPPVRARPPKARKPRPTPISLRELL
jgi:hypothetical protein